MSVFSTIPDQGVAALDGVHETEYRLTATNWRWAIDVAASTVDTTTRLDVEHWHETPDGLRDQHQDISLFLTELELTELLARLLAAREAHQARIDRLNRQENP